MKVEQIGQLSWAKRLRKWLLEAFGTRYVQSLESENLRLRIERDRAVEEMKAAYNRLLDVMAQVKGIPIRPEIKPADPKKVPIGPTRWEQLQARAIEENARAEAEDVLRTGTNAKEN